MVVSRVKKFHQFLDRRYYHIYTDHRPLLGFYHSKPIPVVLSRVLRGNLLLSHYDYELVYHPGQEMGNADMFSTLLLLVKHSNGQPLADVLLL